jgi:DNA-binding transcriptional regulator YiaG
MLNKENNQTESQEQETHTEESEDVMEMETMSLEDLIEDELSDSEVERRQFYSFIHDNDLREEALDLIDQMRGVQSEEQEEVEEENEVSSEQEEVVEENTSLDLKAIRKSLGLNQSEFAKKLGVSQGLVSLLENGKASLTEENEANLKKLLK